MTIKNMKKITVFIGIAAYNSEKNIARLVNTLIKQSAFNAVTSILVYSDGSQDKTVQEVKKIKNKKVKIVAGKERLGYAKVIKYLLSKCGSDISIQFNDDIIIDDNRLIEKIISVFTQNKKIGLLSANTEGLPAKTFIERTSILSLKAFKKMASTINQGNNKFNCDGKVLALSEALIKTISFPKDLNQIGNTDVFLYFLCLKNRFLYHYLRNTKILFRCPSTLSDYVSSISRNKSNTILMKKFFGSLVTREYKRPFLLYAQNVFSTFYKYPLELVLLLCLGTYTFLRSRIVAQSFNQKWQIVLSTKDLV